MPERTYKGPYAETEVFSRDGSSILVKKGESANIPDEVLAGLDENEWPQPKTKAASSGKE